MSPDIRPRLVYLAAYARSGSTFLDTVLDAHPAIFSAGEFTHLFDDVCAGRPCGCGAPLPECDVWGRVLATLDVDPGRARAVTRRCEHGLGNPLHRRRLAGEYRHLWAATIERLLDVVRAEIVVDASKTLQFAARRFALLKTATHYEIRAVHLTRDPRASAWSVRKGGNPIAAGRALKSLDAWRTAVTWSLANIVAERVARQATSTSVRYEDLVTTPGAALDQVGRLLDVDLGGLAQRLEQQGSFPPGHGIAGNRVRRGGPMRLRPDVDWTTSAPRSVHLAARLTWPIARRHRYF